MNHDKGQSPDSLVESNSKNEFQVQLEHSGRSEVPKHISNNIDFVHYADNRLFLNQDISTSMFKASIPLRVLSPNEKDKGNRVYKREHGSSRMKCSSFIALNKVPEFSIFLFPSPREKVPEGRKRLERNSGRCLYIKAITYNRYKFQ